MFVVLSQRLGSDVREGKRRHFNYIGENLDELLGGQLASTLVLANMVYYVPREIVAGSRT